MYLTRHLTPNGPRWAADGQYLPPGLSLATLLALPSALLVPAIGAARTAVRAEGPLLAPIDSEQEVWACGVTYLRSREARVAESETQDVYEKVYDAERVEIFFKAPGWRVRGPGETIRIRRDSRWNVPEPELTLVIGHEGDVVGYTAGNDVSSRDIEGENPLYLPQAKVYDGSCELGPAVVLCGPELPAALPLALEIARDGTKVFAGQTSSDQLKRTPDEMAGWLYRELSFPHGAFLMTGTGLIPPDDFTLLSGDGVRIGLGDLVLENAVA